jgi:hypothetical protein
MIGNHNVQASQLMNTTASIADLAAASGWNAKRAAAVVRRTERASAQIQVRQAARRQANEVVSKVYPAARTFVVKHVEPVSPADNAAAALAAFPRTLTLVTPDHDDPSRDHLFVGPYPVASQHTKFDTAFDELTFATSDGSAPLSGHLRMAGSRTRAYGIVEYGGHSFAVEYQVKPQRYAMRIAEGAAYAAGSANAVQIKWDVNSDRWKNAKWSATDALDFTYGIVGTEKIGNEQVYDFYTSFFEPTTKQTWEPLLGTFAGVLRHSGDLLFSVSGANPPKSQPLFPFQLHVLMSEFGMDFVGGMLTGRNDLTGKVYGLQGKWVGSHVAGLYQLGGNTDPTFLSVHDGKLYAGDVEVPGAQLENNVIRWGALPDAITRATKLKPEGTLTFSSDGHTITASSLGLTGARVHPDVLATPAAQRAHPAAMARTVAAAFANPPGRGLPELAGFSQYVQSDKGLYSDQIQEQAMNDFYQIVQYRMTPGERKFFNPNPSLASDLLGISQVKGQNGGDPIAWYNSLSLSYACGALGHWSTDPAAKMLNSRRAETWIREETSRSDVMQAQMPLLYQRRYMQKYSTLQWYLTDQAANAAGYASAIDSKVAEWIAEMKANVVGDDKQLASLVTQMTELGQVAKDKKLWWAFAFFAYTTRAAYLNMLQTTLASGDEVDGSEFTLRVQRTVALLNVLDPSSYFSQQYGYILQLFQVANLLPQFFDYSADIKDFNFALKQVLDKFIATYLNSPDPQMAAAAQALNQALQQEGQQVLVSKMLEVLRSSNNAIAGLYSWANLAVTFETRAAKVFSSLPAIVSRLVMLGTAGLMISMFATGKVEWSNLSTLEKAGIITNAVGTLAQVTVLLVRRGVAFAAIWETGIAGTGLRAGFRLFFRSDLITKAQKTVSGSFAWILETGKGRAELEMLDMGVLMGRRAGGLGARTDSALVKLFGRNLNQFMATRLGAALAIVGVVMSAIELSKGGDSLETATNALFVASSGLELISVLGAWAIGTSTAAIGGLAISSILACISVVGVIALVAGVILMAILMSRPQKSPMEQFVENAGRFYMPGKTNIDYFEVYQPQGTPQLSGVSVSVDGDTKRCLSIAAEGTLRQATFDATGSTALYLKVDGQGYAQFGAPLTDAQGKPTLLVLGLDAKGNLGAFSGTDDVMKDQKTRWVAELQGDGEFQTGSDGNSYLHAASFKFYNAGLFAATGARRYLQAAGNTGWTTSDGNGATVKLTMVVTAPADLHMSDVLWYTFEHDESQAPSLGLPGSEPRTWSIRPDLPKGLTFSKDTGTVAMEPGVDVPPAASATYQLTVKNAAGQASATFSLAIAAGSIALAAAA